MIPKVAGYSLMKQSDNDDALPVVVAPEKKPTFLQRIFGKKDTTAAAKKVEVKEVDAKTKLKEAIEKSMRDG